VYGTAHRNHRLGLYFFLGMVVLDGLKGAAMTVADWRGRRHPQAPRMRLDVAPYARPGVRVTRLARSPSVPLGVRPMGANISSPSDCAEASRSRSGTAGPTIWSACARERPGTLRERQPRSKRIAVPEIS
jgi:hypothetical protein